MRYFIDLMYDGTSHSGWQIQANANTVQEELNKALSMLLGTTIPTMGSGRTDAGVHARQQIAHFDFETIEDLENLRFRLNALIPDTLAIRSIRPVKEDAHARFSAVSRSYQYFIHARKDPFRKGRSYYFSKSLNLGHIEEAIKIFLTWKDFESFSKVQTDVNHYLCDIFEARWNEEENGGVFEVRANRFLRGMVRAMVGTLLDVGIGKLTPEAVKEILEARDRNAASRSVPAQGLFLTRVEYPEDIYLD